MKAVLFIISLILLGACSTAKKKGISDPLDELQGFSNTDFEKDETIPYSKSNDRFDLEVDTLSPETLGKLQPETIDRISSEDDLLLAVAACYRKKIKSGLKTLDKIYPKFKKHPSYWTMVGTCYLLNNEERKALLYYNKALDLDAKYAPPINNIGVIYRRRGEDQKALKAFEKASQANKFSLTPIFNIAQLYLEYGLVDESLKLFNVLLNKGKKDSDVYGALGNAYLLKGDTANALKYFDKVAYNLTIRPDIGLNYAVALKLAKRRNEAKTVFNRVKNLSNKKYESYSNRVKSFVYK